MTTELHEAKVQTQLLRTIRNVLVFWTALTLGAAVVGLLWLAASAAS